MENKKAVSPSQLQYLEKLGYPKDQNYEIKTSNSFKNPGKEYLSMNGVFCFFLDKPQKYSQNKHVFNVKEPSMKRWSTNDLSEETQPFKIRKTEDDRLSKVIEKLDIIEQMLYEIIKK